ncbi:MAG: hypothetical protein LBN01_03610 [Endomicrobium sp.]|jgi:hypothetical protein|nr:hypothetical protein [Endomicrobium sp.]
MEIIYALPKITQVPAIILITATVTANKLTRDDTVKEQYLQREPSTA